MRTPRPFRRHSEIETIFLSLSPAKGLSQTTEQFGNRKFQRARYFLNIDQRNVALAAFDSSDIGPVHFLGDSQFVPSLPDGFTESDTNIVDLPLRVIFVPRSLCVHGL
jgi:hypothetical protein